jgi:hypothetical protein
MNPRERVISVVLTDAEWKAFLSLQPQPVAWLRERISEEIKSTSASETQPDAAYTRSARSH